MFFLVGANLDDSTADVLQRMIKEGHLLGSHSFGHAHLTWLGNHCELCVRMYEMPNTHLMTQVICVHRIF